MIAAAAVVGLVSTEEVLSKIKMNLARSDNPKAKSSIRKSRALSMALNREKKKVMGHGGTIPNTADDFFENLEKFNTTSTRTLFLPWTMWMLTSPN
jgi:hypothetical protein